tara:strand:- start:500 stop:871 length:372 start_codon:yes stop_codon:yes gene_type:complete
MAHFAQLDNNNIVMQVIVVHNNELLENGIEIEEKGIDFCKSLFGSDTYWKQTSYNGNFRKNYAGIGFSYDFQRDAFIPPQPFPSWTLDENTYHWQSPIPYPDDGKIYYWDESQQTWVEGVTNV